MSISTSSEKVFHQTEDEIEALISLSFDAHCHYHLDQSHEANKESERLLRSLAGAALMTMSEEDWGRAKSYVRGSKSTYYSLGVHPWLAHRYVGQEAWLFALRDQLCEEPQTTIGEIGLDRKWRTPDTGKVEYEAQLEVFNAQLKLAGELGRAVSIHCVHAQGDLQDALRRCESLPPAIYLHAFGGARGTAEQLLKSKRFGDRLYFGFASCVNLRSPKTRSVIDLIPRERLLLESDRSSPLKVRRELIEMMSVYRELKGWESLEAVAEQTTENAQRFYLQL